MANSWFQFKQFKVEQGKTAMKVGTDGVLLGAWASVGDAKNILDVGTGTGLIALMLAQRNQNAEITAIDIDRNAVEQAAENAEQSPWSGRISIFESDYNHFRVGESSLFDLIVSNPPYFKQSLKSPTKSRSIARHDHMLSHDDLIGHSIRLLKDGGRLCVILPYVEGSVFIALAASKGLFCTKKTNVFATPNAEVKRLLLEFSKIQVKMQEDSLVIEEGGRHAYSKEYLALTRDFYLFG